MGRILTNRPVLVILIAIVVMVLLMCFTGTELLGAGSALGSVVTPIQGTVASAYYGTSNLVSTVFGAGAEQEQKRLEERVAELEIESQSLRDMAQENERLKELLAYKEAKPELTMRFAKVTSKDPGYWFDTFIVDAGYNQGILKNMPVVNADGLIGRISEVGGNWSRVQSILDSKSAVSAIIERTSDHGIIQGEVLSGGTCSMTFIPIESDVVPGDRVMTSDFDGISPRGILVGEIQEVKTDSGQPQKRAQIKTAVDFNHIQEVLIITTQKDAAQQ